MCLAVVGGARAQEVPVAQAAAAFRPSWTRLQALIRERSLDGLEVDVCEYFFVAKFF